MTAHAGGFTCAQVDEGSQHLADAVSRQREELRGEREKFRQVVEINNANQRSYWAENDALRGKLEALRDVAEACAAIPAMFARANVGEISAAEEWVCITCEERNVTRSDEDRCCIQCGMDLTERGELLRFLLAPAPALKPLALVEDRTPEQLAADGDLDPGDAASPEAQSRASQRRSMMLLEACDAIPDVTISKWACDPGGHWNRVREVLRARRAAQGFDVDAADPETAFDEHGWLKQRAEVR